MERNGRIRHQCVNGHTFYKSSQCRSCPTCARENKKTFFIPNLSAPAQRALTLNGIFNLVQLSAFSSQELLSFHGLGPSSIPKIISALKAEGLSLQ